MIELPRRILRLTLAYDGTEFHGWQRQRGVRTVQDVVEAAARRVLREPAVVVGASRTDAGVHARGQAAHLATDSTIPADRLHRAIGHRLPADVSLVELSDAPPSFDAIRDARRKRYRYRIHNAPGRPVERLAQRYAWHVWHALDVDRMRAAAGEMTGTRDFSCFAGTGSPRRHNVRTIWRVDVRRTAERVVIDVEGDGFLYNQVRNMVGTLYEVGRGRWPADIVAEIVASGDRRRAGPTAPALGLCLQWVDYDGWRSAPDEPPQVRDDP